MDPQFELVRAQIKMSICHQKQRLREQWAGSLVPSTVRADAPADEGLVQQLLDNNARLKAELNRMELKCATAEGIALGKAPYMEDLHNQLKAANEQIEQLRLARCQCNKEAAEAREAGTLDW